MSGNSAGTADKTRLKPRVPSCLKKLCCFGFAWCLKIFLEMGEGGFDLRNSGKGRKMWWWYLVGLFSLQTWDGWGGSNLAIIVTDEPPFSQYKSNLSSLQNEKNSGPQQQVIEKITTNLTPTVNYCWIYLHIYIAYTNLSSHTNILFLQSTSVYWMPVMCQSPGIEHE